jgi:hypothetical protein
MKTWLPVLALLFISSYAALAQLRISAGQTWAYQFSALPFQGVETGGIAGPPVGGAHVEMTNSAPGTYWVFSLYEDNLSQTPIFVTDSVSNQVTRGVSGGGVGIWQDLQGWVELKVITGAITIDSVEIDARISTGYSSDKHYGVTIPVVAPTIQSSPLTQTTEVGESVDLWTRATGFDPFRYLWYFNKTNFVGYNTDFHLQLTNLQFSRAGAYTVVVTNAVGAVTSSPAILSLIPAVQRRPVPAIGVTGETGTVFNVEYASSPEPQSGWQTLDATTLSLSPQYWFDVFTPLPQQRFYRVGPMGASTALPSFSLVSIVPAITLTGNIGKSVRVDYINAIGPTNAWVTLGTVVLTNTSQLYFDVAAPSQPKRFYRLVQVP